MQPARSDRQDGEALEAEPFGFDYELPDDRIAQEPAAERDGARLLMVRRGAPGEMQDSSIRELPRWLEPGDLLVVNRSRVIPARLRARGPGGGRIEIMLLDPSDDSDGRPCWRALCRPARRLRAGAQLVLLGAEGSSASTSLEIVRRREGLVWVAFPVGTDVNALAEREGETPLPPYVRRPAGPTDEDRERYQTIFAREPGSVAAPTAGLHLSASILAQLRERGVEVAELILHVGPATFLAGRRGHTDFTVDPERYLVPPATREAILRARERGRVIAVGTTTTRALESASRAGWPSDFSMTSLVLRPGSSFEVVQGLLTNFHLPRTSLLALVAAFAGVEAAREAYRRAVASGYRFYSYGDAMLIL